jgi:hypothetical protein
VGRVASLSGALRKELCRPTHLGKSSSLPAIAGKLRVQGSLSGCRGRP